MNDNILYIVYSVALAKNFNQASELGEKRQTTKIQNKISFLMKHQIRAQSSQFQYMPWQQPKQNRKNEKSTKKTERMQFEQSKYT